MNKNIIFVFLSVACLALGGIFVKLSLLGPISTAMYRVLFSLPVFLFIAQYSKQKISFKDKIVAMIAGVFLAFDLILWNISFSFTTVANANLLANLVPFTVVPLSYLIYREKITKLFLVGGTIILLGSIVLMSGKTTISVSYFKGDFLAILTSVFYGLFLITVYKLRHQVSTILIMTYASIGSLITLVPIAVLTEGIQIPTTTQALLPLLGLALLSQILGQGGLSYCLGKIPANLASLLVLTQPLISGIYAFVWFNERISLIEFTGMITVLIGLYLANKKIKPPNKLT